MRACRITDVARFQVFWVRGLRGKHKLYLSEFLFVSLHVYLEFISYMCSFMVLIDESPGLWRCGAIWGFVTGEWCAGKIDGLLYPRNEFRYSTGLFYIWKPFWTAPRTITEVALISFILSLHLKLAFLVLTLSRHYISVSFGSFIFIYISKTSHLGIECSSM